MRFRQTHDMWQVVREWLLDAVYPDHCCGCGALGSLLCAACYNRLSMQLKPIILTAELSSIDSMQVLTEFDQLSHTLIVAYKYQSIKRLSDVLARIMLDHCHFPECSVITSVPMHPQKQVDRGYNQSELLARVIATNRDIPYQDLLKKRSRGQIQAKLNYKERWQQVASLFTMRENSLALTNQSILIIDDVMTTGATLQACALELKKHGASAVHAVCFSHGA